MTSNERGGEVSESGQSWPSNFERPEKREYKTTLHWNLTWYLIWLDILHAASTNSKFCENQVSSSTFCVWKNVSCKCSKCDKNRFLSSLCSDRNWYYDLIFCMRPAQTLNFTKTKSVHQLFAYEKKIFVNVPNLTKIDFWRVCARTIMTRMNS